MPRQITSATSLDNLRKEAKRWLKALRDGDAEARARFEQAYAPSGPAEAGRHVHAAPAKPGLRDVQHALAREHGRDNWIALKQAVEQPQHDRLTEDMLLAFNGHDEQALQRLNDHYKRLFIVELDHVTSLTLGGSRELTDDGLLLLARMSQLERLNLSEFPGGNLTDRGLEVLRHLPNLRRFEMTWQRGITDVGVANLKYCDQ